MTNQIQFTPGERVKVINGPFATYTGNIKKVNRDRQMLMVIVQLERSNPLVKAGAGEVPVELRFQDVKKEVS